MFNGSIYNVLYLQILRFYLVGQNFINPIILHLLYSTGQLKSGVGLECIDGRCQHHDALCDYVSNQCLCSGKDYDVQTCLRKYPFTIPGLNKYQHFQFPVHACSQLQVQPRYESQNRPNLVQLVAVGCMLVTSVATCQVIIITILQLASQTDCSKPGPMCS